MPYDDSSAHDMGGNIIPMFVDHNDAQVYDFDANMVPGATDRDRGYWRDVGTLDAYYEAHMDLISVHPVFNLYNHDWPIYTHHRPLPPAKIVHENTRVVDSMLSNGVIVADSVVAGSVLSPRVHIDEPGRGRRQRLMDNVRSGRCGHPQRHRRQERDDSRGAPGSASTSSATRRASRCPTTASS